MIPTCEAGNLTLEETCADAGCICNARVWPACVIIDVSPRTYDADAVGILIADRRYLPVAAG